MNIRAHLFLPLALLVTGAGCISSQALAENQCSYNLETEKLRCGNTYILASSALPGEYTLEKGEEVQVPKDRLLSISKPKVADEQAVYHFLYLDESRIYEVGEDETEKSLERKLETEIERRNQPAQ
ncbi:MAG: hypothetical protein NUW08_00440 [Candidatus Uhrbacteria bacterium]|nr:hypothetical protein [Candidatus Uhrbacteria bacterium]